MGGLGKEGREGESSRLDVSMKQAGGRHLRLNRIGLEGIGRIRGNRRGRRGWNVLITFK